METITFVSQSSFSFNPLLDNSRKLCDRRRHCSVKIMASRRSEAHDRNYRGRLVDENMIVLRKRIHEMKMIERNYEPPSDWMEWEKKYYTSYDSFICEAMGFLQSQLMNTRPTVTLGLLALIAFSVPFSSAIAFSHFLDLVGGVLAGIHLG